MPIDTILNNGFTQENMILEFYTLMLPRYNHILLHYDSTMYLVNMRNKLDTILNEVGSISAFTQGFKDDCFEKIRKTHKDNWEANSADTIDRYYEDEDGFWHRIPYDPDKD
jgi:hypothetical protein